MNVSGFSLRAWATPLTIGSFVLMSITGILLFFDWDRGLTAVVHQWFSWLFLIGVSGHVILNSRPFMKHLKTGGGRALMAFFAAVLLASSFSWGIVTGPQLRRPVERALINAPLSALASVTRADHDALVRRLKAHGIVAHEQQSVHDISNKSGVSESRLLALIFLSE